MNKRFRLFAITASFSMMLFLFACEGKVNNVEEVDINNQNDVVVIDNDEAADSLELFLEGKCKAYRGDVLEGFYISDLQMEDNQWDSYSIGDMIDLDNDGLDELILNGPYGGMYLDCEDGKVSVFAEGEGTALQLSYVYYEDAYWIVYSDTLHSGRSNYSLIKYNGAKTIEESFSLSAEYESEDNKEDGKYTYRDKSITMEEFDELLASILGVSQEESSVTYNFPEELPLAYREVLIHCFDIIKQVDETSQYNLLETEEEVYGFADAVLHAGVSNEDFGYEYIDLNDDDIMELIIAYNNHDKDNYTLMNVYTLEDDTAILLANAYFHNYWYLNDNKELVNLRVSTPAYHEFTVYEFKKNSVELTEKYCLYNKYLDDSKEVAHYERIDGGQDSLVAKYDNIEKIWNYFEDKRNEYISNYYELELTSIYTH